MKRPITIVELAKQLDVHPSTISLGLRKSHHVSKALQERIFELAKQTGYSPNHMARSLVKRSSKTLGAIFPYATEPYYSMLLDALYAQTLARGFHLEISFHQWNSEEEKIMLQMMIERQVEGLILLPSSPALFETLGNSSSSVRNLPIALVGSTKPALSSCICGCVYTDLQKCSQELGQHLLEMGHRRIALLTPHFLPDSDKESALAMSDREIGLRRALTQCPDAQLEAIYVNESDRERYEKYLESKNPNAIERNFELSRLAAENLINLPTRPTAVVTTNETSAFILLESLATHGIRFPGDISIACYDGTFLSQYGSCPLTCIKQPFDQIAWNLVDLVLSPPKKRSLRKPEWRVLQPTLAIRGSVSDIRLQPKKI